MKKTVATVIIVTLLAVMILMWIVSEGYAM